jgi:hypothetical protein
LKRGKLGDGKVALAKVNKYDDLKNGIRVDVNQLNLVVMDKATKEFTGGETESSLEKRGQHHYLVGVRSEDYFILGRSSLEDGTVGKKMLPYKLEELFLIDEGWFELIRMRCNHVAGGEILGK